MNEMQAKGWARRKDPTTGRFLPTHPRHDKPTSYKKELREALLAAVTPEDIADITNAMVKRACKGDVEAARLILDRVFGRPTQATYRETNEVQTLQIDLTNMSDEVLAAALKQLESKPAIIEGKVA